MKFISDGTWFDINTEAKLVDDCWWECYHIDKGSGEMVRGKSGLFEGLRKGQVDQECCGFEEFAILEDEVSET